MTKIRPTLRLRWLEPRDIKYEFSANFYECEERIPVRTLQQWWGWPDGKDDEGYAAYGEWRDVPIEVE